MGWVCPADRKPLERAGDRLRCRQCDRGYRIESGIPIFVDEANQKKLARKCSSALTDLWKLMRSQSSAEAAKLWCAEHSSTRSLVSADWKFYLTVPSGGTVLELGAGFGDDTLSFAGRQAKTISIVPQLPHALILQRHLEEAGHTGASIAIMDRPSRLPLPDSSVDLIVLEDVAAAGLGLDRRTLADAAAEWRRVLRPGGALFLGLGNPLYRLAPLQKLLTAMQSRERLDSLDRRLKRESSAGRPPRLPFAKIGGYLSWHGFTEPLLLAPLPDEKSVQLVLPLKERNVVRYFLNNLVRRNSRLISAALRIASALNALGLFRHIVPYHYLIFKAPAEPGGER